MTRVHDYEFVLFISCPWQCNFYICSVLEQSNWPQDEYLYRKEMSKIIDQHMKDQRRRGLVGLIVFNAHRNMYAMEKFYVSLAQFHDLSIWTADENTKRLLTALSIEDGHISTILSDNPANAGIHILPDAKLEKDVSFQHKQKMFFVLAL